MVVTIKQGTDLAAVLDKTVACRLHIGVWGVNAGMSTALVESEVDPDMMSISKKKLQSPELKALTNFSSEVRNYLKARSVPSPFSNGIYLVPVVLSEDVANALDDFQIRWKLLVNIFVGSFDERKLSAQVKLGPAYDELDYPDEEELRSRFGFEWGFVSFGTPQNLPSRLFRREAEKAQQQWGEALDEMQTLLRVEVQNTIKELVERLSGESDDGRKKTIRADMVEKVQELMGMFSAKNVTDDAELQAMIDQAKSMLKGVDSDLIKTSRATKLTIKEGFEQIQLDLGKLITDAPVRRFRFDD